MRCLHHAWWLLAGFQWITTSLPVVNIQLHTCIYMYISFGYLPINCRQTKIEYNWYSKQSHIFHYNYMYFALARYFTLLKAYILCASMTLQWWMSSEPTSVMLLAHSTSLVKQIKRNLFQDVCVVTRSQIHIVDFTM